MGVEFTNIQPPQKGSASKYHQPKGARLQIPSTNMGSASRFHQPKRESASWDNFYGASGTTQTLKTVKKGHVKIMIIQKMFKSIVLTAASSTFEVHFHSTYADRHGSTKDRSFRLHKQIKTPKLISYRKKLERREKKKQLTELAANLQLCYTSDGTSRTIHKQIPLDVFLSDVPKKPIAQFRIFKLCIYCV